MAIGKIMSLSVHGSISISTKTVKENNRPKPFDVLSLDFYKWDICSFTSTAQETE